ncbi:cell wall protein DAN4-like isoform X3, partial [Clarias magur]
KRSCREKNICVLECGDETADSVTWSRDVDGKREKILTVYRNTVTKHIADPHGRYSSGEHLILSIFGFSHSDSGRYHCNENTVELSVKGTQDTTTADECLRAAAVAGVCMLGFASVLVINRYFSKSKGSSDKTKQEQDSAEG